MRAMLIYSRFPFLFPIVTPELVARKVVEGIQRELDYIYIPTLIGWLAMFSWWVGHSKFKYCYV